MSFIRSLFRNALSVIGAISRPDFRIKVVDDHPSHETIAMGYIYIVESKVHQKWAYLRCPSLPSEVIQLSLMTSRRPSWTIAVDWLERPTLYPSIRQLEGSFAHFWIRNGRIDWCLDTGRPYTLRVYPRQGQSI